MTKITDAELQRGLLVHHELREHIARLATEGFQYREIMAGIASLTNELIATTHNQATASAWFFGMAKQAAHLAAAELPPET
ncbi:hypothetical protein [Allosphingosinicella deserti]|uniref:Uncharacterized protein n=1 Tax=Allosphingosinicella deserti TaxID=2116704 RepID=A0A2P7QW21_9SPHN|nr:hypothetical protein [Sphingomonas deserti]PSJ42153.1 hypothetical protein C7I55_07925 [Sphingomonas deserti]